MCFTSELHFTFDSICPTVKTLRAFCLVLLTNEAIHYKYHNWKLWINKSTSKCSGVSGRLSLINPLHQAVHMFTQRYPKQCWAKRPPNKLTHWNLLEVNSSLPSASDSINVWRWRRDNCTFLLKHSGALVPPRTTACAPVDGTLV